MGLMEEQELGSAGEGLAKVDSAREEMGLAARAQVDSVSEGQATEA